MAEAVTTRRAATAGLDLRSQGRLPAREFRSRVRDHGESRHPFALILTIVLQLSTGIAIAVGWQTRLGAAALGLFCLTTAVLFHTNFAIRNFCISRRTLRYQAGCGS
jgi:uncharacterized membrane protein YphA (DoxX/SURF4 family)